MLNIERNVEFVSSRHHTGDSWSGPASGEPGPGLVWTSQRGAWSWSGPATREELQQRSTCGANHLKLFPVCESPCESAAENHLGHCGARLNVCDESMTSGLQPSKSSKKRFSHGNNGLHPFQDPLCCLTLLLLLLEGPSVSSCIPTFFVSRINHLFHLNMKKSWSR